MHACRSLLLALALAAVPAAAGCAGKAPLIANPIAAAETLDQRAYAALETYAVLVEEAADLLADPRTPRTLARALIAAEAAATPALETAEIALSAYLRARARYDADPSGAAAALAAAAAELETALARARAPIAELQALLQSR